jgi:transposase
MLHSLQKLLGGRTVALKVRALTEEETTEVYRLAHSRTAAHRVVQRAHMIWASAQGVRVPIIARRVGLSAPRVRTWIRRFNARGLAGLADRPRAGRPRRHDETTRGTVTALARTKPHSLGYPFALWTLARLQQALQERHGLCVTPATVWKWLQAEGLVWKRQQSWFQVTVDAAFISKRGPSSKPTPSRSPSGALSASMSWGRSARRPTRARFGKTAQAERPLPLTTADGGVFG